MNTEMIVSKKLEPSRPDAVRLRRNEKLAMLHFMYAVTVLEDSQKDLEERIDMICGKEQLKIIAHNADLFLNELRKTVPENQRIGLMNAAKDYVIRMMPAAVPGETRVVLSKDEFRQLIDCARAKCRDCVLDDNECEGCELFQLLTCILPMDNYHALNLCVYNLGEWKN